MAKFLTTKVRYREANYKYQLADDLIFENTGIQPAKEIKTPFIILTPEGKLTLRSGYASDGPSGPTLDTLSSIRGAFGHDAFYQLIRMELLGSGWRIPADDFLSRVLKEDGMWWWRRWYWVRAVKKFAGSAADPKNLKPILEAP